jgi:hypothetical protein
MKGLYGRQFCPLQLSVCLWHGTTAQALKLFKSVDFILKLVDNFDLHLDCPITKCSVPKAIKNKQAAKNGVAKCVYCVLQNAMASYWHSIGLTKAVGVPAQVTGKTLHSFFDTSFFLSLLPSRGPWTTPRACYSPLLPTSYGTFPVLVYSLATDL